MDTTTNLNLPIPNENAVPPTNISAEFPRIALAFVMLDTIINTMQGVVAGKANSEHSQAISTITGLTEALAAKMPANAEFSLDDLTDVQGAADALVNYVLVRKASGQWEPSSALAALGPHGHLISEILGLGDVLAGKADASATYTKSQVDTALATKANQGTTYTKTEVDESFHTKNINNSATVATASGSAFDFTEIPYWTKRITISLDGPSLTGTNDLLVQVGTANGIEASGYISGSGGAVNSTAGFVVRTGNAVREARGAMVLMKAPGNTWISSHSINCGVPGDFAGGGSKTLADSLDRIRLTRTGSDSFDGGSVTIFWE